MSTCVNYFGPPIRSKRRRKTSLVEASLWIRAKEDLGCGTAVVLERAAMVLGEVAGDGMVDGAVE